MMCYYSKVNGAILWRSSQPRQGRIGGVHKSDKKMMKSITDTLLPKPKSGIIKRFSDPKKDQATLHIYDARSKIAAFGNKLKGSGYEDVSEYPFAWITFCDIGNIHLMRDSYNKMLALCNDPKSPRWLDRLDRSGWLYHSANLIRSINDMIESFNVIKLIS